ncbi:MAG TPA: hypothetical protein VG034_15655 [Acidimicrobiia bacterium]|nr:hypothetical protein [Acidimicrobiia bacterium]
MDEVDVGTILAIATLVVACVGYLSRQMNRMDDRLSARIDGLGSNLGSRIDQLTERYIAHLERHSH